MTSINATENSNKHEELIEEIIHGKSWTYEWLRKLQGATEFKRKIPKEYIYSGECSYTEVFGIGETKKEACEARLEIIQEIIYVLLNRDKTRYGHVMMPDNYSRLFHALAILKLEKETDLLPGTTENFSYNTSYMLWRLDDGSESVGKTIESTTWFMAEALKQAKGGYKAYCIKGEKC